MLIRIIMLYVNFWTTDFTEIIMILTHEFIIISKPT